MRIWTWLEALMGFLFGLVALVAASGSFFVAYHAEEILLCVVSGLVAMVGWVLGTYLIMCSDSEIRPSLKQRWATSSIRRNLVQLREKLGQRLAHMTMAHMGQVIARLSGEVKDLREGVKFIAADRMSLYLQTLGLNRKVQAIIREARSWKSKAMKLQVLCWQQEAELRNLRPKHERRRTVMRAYYARGEKPEGMSLRVWSALNKLVKELQNDKFMELAMEVAKIEERNRQSWRWKTLLSSAGTARATDGEQAPGMVDGYTIEKVLKAFSIEDAFMIGSILAGEMVDSGMLAAQNAVKEGRAYQHAFMMTFPAQYAARWHELSRLVNHRA